MSKLRLTVLDAGPLNPDKNKLVAFAPGRVAVPTTVGVIEHPRHGVVLWDTGISPVVADPDRGDAYWGAGLRDAFGAHGFTRAHAVDAQLERLGIKPAEVRYVVYSHLHLDHAGGMSCFPGAVHVVQRDEIRYALWPDAWTRPVYCQNDFQDIRTLDILELDGDFDLFGDGSLRLLKTPGHAPGHQALLLDLAQRGRVCLGADVGHQRDGYEAMVPMPWDWSTSAMSMTRMRMRQMERAGIPVFLCHDAGDFDKLPRDGAFWD
ncbi:N-acyl homoserine lactonase family protein [Roseicella aquatilis]|nr:N-acyl homoserine lactonase family protein [Roseicella aquatilis]